MAQFTEERRRYTGAVVVKCPYVYIDAGTVQEDGSIGPPTTEPCGREFTLTPQKRNDPRFSGHWCDGSYRRSDGETPGRHPVRLCVGPDGHGYA